MPQMIADQVPLPALFEHPDRPDPGAGRDADDAVGVVQGADRAGDVGAVAVAVVGGVAGRAVLRPRC